MIDQIFSHIFGILLFDADGKLLIADTVKHNLSSVTLAVSDLLPILVTLAIVVSVLDLCFSAVTAYTSESTEPKDVAEWLAYRVVFLSFLLCLTATPLSILGLFLLLMTGFIYAVASVPWTIQKIASNEYQIPRASVFAPINPIEAAKTSRIKHPDVIRLMQLCIAYPFLIYAVSHIVYPELTTVVLRHGGKATLVLGIWIYFASRYANKEQ